MRRYVYLVEVRPVDATGTEQPQYWSCGQSADPQPYGGIEFVNCLKGSGDDGGPFTYTADIPLDATVGGRSQVGYGSLRLDMQHLDNFALSALSALLWDGRAVKIWRVLEGAAWSLSDAPMFRGTVDVPTWGVLDATVPLYDRARELDTPWQQSTYLGTGEYEGQTDIAGQRKPKLLGNVRNCEVVALDHAVPSAGGDPYSRVAQINDGPISQAFGVNAYERGLAFADASIHPVSDVYAWTPIAGHVAVDFGRGVIRYGTTPVGVSTCDCKADEVSSTHVGIMVQVLLKTNAFSSGDFDSAALSALDALYPSDAGIYIRDERTTAEVLDALAASIGSAWSFTLAGLFTVRQIGFRASVDTITVDDMLDDPRPVPLPLPVWRYRYGYEPNERVLTPTDIGDAQVVPSRKAFLGEAFRFDQGEDPAVKTLHPLAREAEVPGRFFNAGPARTEASRQGRLVRQDRRQFVFTVRRQFSALREGDTVTWIYPGFGLDAGADFIVRAATKRPSLLPDEDEIELTLWGPFIATEDRRVTP